MTTRRARFEREATERRLEKRREERLIKGLESARNTLTAVIKQVDSGDSRAFYSLEQFSDEMDRIYRQAERMEYRER